MHVQPSIAKLGDVGGGSPELLAAKQAAPRPQTPRQAKKAGALFIKEATNMKTPYNARPTKETDLRPVGDDRYENMSRMIQGGVRA